MGGTRSGREDEAAVLVGVAEPLYLVYLRVQVAPQGASAASLNKCICPDEQTAGMQAAGRGIRSSGVVQMGGVSLSMLQRLTAIDWFSGARKQGVRDVIAFCRAGGFTIG